MNDTVIEQLKSVDSQQNCDDLEEWKVAQPEVRTLKTGAIRKKIFIKNSVIKRKLWRLL